MFGEDFIRKASGLYVPPLIGLAVNPLGRFQPCGAGTCCPFSPASCQGCSNSFAGRTIWIDIPIMANDGCLDCGDWEGTYSLALNNACYVTGSRSDRCGLDNILVCQEFDGSTCTLSAHLSHHFPGGSTCPEFVTNPGILWRLELDEVADPLDHLLPFLTETNSGCDPTGTEAHLYES